MTNDTQTIQLRDGRTLAYTEHGAPDGLPVIFFHGNPGSRFMRHPDESIAESVGVRIITPDRPGYGLSDFKPNRTLLDTPADVADLLDALGIDTFATLGISAGGPHVAATCYLLRDRVTKAAIVSGAAPFDRDGALDDVNETYRQAYKVAKWPRWILKPMMRLQMRSELKDPEKNWQEILGRATDSDREVLRRPEIKEQVQGYRPEAVRQGVDGWVQEAQLLVKPWGFPVKAIPTEVHLWYWAGDTIVPRQMGQYLADEMPNAVRHFHPGGGHFAWVDHWGDILESIR
jgi:pimeloyl-ACP methyl ester carboxylesterase